MQIWIGILYSDIFALQLKMMVLLHKTRIQSNNCDKSQQIFKYQQNNNNSKKTKIIKKKLYQLDPISVKDKFHFSQSSIFVY